jgi:hypothetical protein
MTSLQPQSTFAGTVRPPPLRPWPALMPLDRAPIPKPLVMGGTLPPLPAMARVRTRWQPLNAPVFATDGPTGAPSFPIAPANDPIERLADDDRAGLTLLTLVLCVTVAIALLGFGLQVLQ